jgi:hypothetical protein
MKTFLLIVLTLLGGVCFVRCAAAPDVQERETPLEENEPAAGAEAADDSAGEVEVEEVSQPSAALPVSSYGEIWAYVLNGKEEAFKPGLPLSDAGYFGAEVNVYGKLSGVPDRKKLKGFAGRVHLVVACFSQPLNHFVLLEGGEHRGQLIKDLLDAAKDFDGVQIDFEQVPAKDGPAFLSFLADLRRGLGNKRLSVAVPARTERSKDTVYNYQKIAAIADKVLVMAYDEHWSGSGPGPIASMGWCGDVARYALKTIGRDKLVMGLPFYGRSWGSFITNRALIFTQVENIRKAQGVDEVNRKEGVPAFVYEAPVKVTVYYEDEHSLAARLKMYRGLGVQAVGFWRLGQESPGVWNALKLNAASD